MTHAPADGITLSAFLLLLVLLAAWAAMERAYRRRELVEDEHARRGRVLATIDRIFEADYREELRFTLSTAELLGEEKAA